MGTTNTNLLIAAVTRSCGRFFSSELAEQNQQADDDERDRDAALEPVDRDKLRENAAENDGEERNHDEGEAGPEKHGQFARPFPRGHRDDGELGLVAELSQEKRQKGRPENFPVHMEYFIR